MVPVLPLVDPAEVDDAVDLRVVVIPVEEDVEAAAEVKVEDKVEVSVDVTGEV